MITISAPNNLNRNARPASASADMAKLIMIDGETRERSWCLLRKGGRLISTSAEPSQDRANALGLTAMRYIVEPDGGELVEIGKLADSGKLKPHIQATFPLQLAGHALATVGRGHTAGKVVLTCG